MTRFSPWIIVLLTSATIATAAPTSPARADDLDCSFFEAQAEGRLPIDFAVRMRDACHVLNAYQHTVTAESLRYAFGDAAVAPEPAANRYRSRMLDTPQVLPEMERYFIARDVGVFALIREIP